MVRSLLPKFSSKSERRLQSLCKNNPNEDVEIKKWNKNAIQYLVKKLKKNLDVIDELERAISQESANTKCVPLPKTADNRLLVSHRRCLPQVIYCRLWRWPDLQSHHQIKAISNCCSNVEQDGLEQRPPRMQTICVNPYHYERKRPAALEQVLVPCSRIPPDLSTSFEDSDPSGGTKAIPHRISLPTTITGATVRSILSAATSQATTLHQNHIDSTILAAHTTLEYDKCNNLHLVNSQDITADLNPQTSITMAEQHQLQDISNRDIPQQGDEEVYMSYERDPVYLPQENSDGFEYIPILPADTTPQQYEQQVYIEPQPPLFIQEQTQSQPQPPLHMQHLHHEQPVQVSYQTQSQAQQQQVSVQGQQIPMQPQHQIPGQLNQHLQQTVQQPHLDHIQQQQQLRQLPQQNVQQPQQQYHQVPNPQQQPVQQGGSILRQTINTQTEVARPYQFKPNKFAHLARAMHEHNVDGQQRPNYDPHGYAPRPYSYTQQPAPLQQSQQVQYSQQYQHQHGVSTPYSNHTQHAQYPPHPPPSYATIYPQQDQYSRQDQMQLDYQQTTPMAVGGMQQGTYYGEPVAGPSHIIDQSMQPVSTIDFQEVPYTEGASWCSISYHEYDQRVGEKYQPSSLTVSVDGYTHPMCSDRFCIGGLSNVNRNEFTEWVRRRIGKGVRFTYVDGEVHVECLCESSIFISSPMLGMEDGKDIVQERVSKVTHGGSIRVFSNPQFSKLLSSAVLKGFEAVYKLTSYCTFRVSFVKGWGRSYKRQTILNTPCWVEVQLNGPLQWIDKVLRQMRPPQGCGSTS